MPGILSVLPTLLIILSVVSSARAQNHLTVEGSEFVLTLSDGATLRSADLVGAEMLHATAQGNVRVVIEATEPVEARNGETIILHTFSVVGEHGSRKPLCQADPSGDRRGFPVADGEKGYELLCVSGARAKCSLWGYQPWAQLPAGPSAGALHAACVRLVRANYGGDGVAATHVGRQIALCDRYGIAICGNAPYPFEAAWGATGAVCVARTRLGNLLSLKDLSMRYPHLRGKLGKPGCTEEDVFGNEDVLLLSFSPSSGALPP